MHAPLVFNFLPCNSDHKLNRINEQLFSFNPTHDHSWKESSPSFHFLSISMSYAFLQSSLHSLYLLCPPETHTYWLYPSPIEHTGTCKSPNLTFSNTDLAQQEFIAWALFEPKVLKMHSPKTKSIQSNLKAKNYLEFYHLKA